MSENPPCGEEGHVCACSNEVADTSVPVMTGTPEDWVLQELEMAEERLKMVPDGPEIFELTYGTVIAVHAYLMEVKITSRHDEIIAAYRKAVLDLAHAADKLYESERFLKSACLFLPRKLGFVNARGFEKDTMGFFKYISLGVFVKLQLERTGKSIADVPWNDQWLELNTNDEKFKAAMKAAWGE